MESRIQECLGYPNMRRRVAFVKNCCLRISGAPNENTVQIHLKIIIVKRIFVTVNGNIGISLFPKNFSSVRIS